MYKEINSLFKIALPLMAAFLAQKGMQTVDTFMMGWIGPQALAAGALSTSVFMLALTFCMGMLSAVGVFVARAYGANQNEDIQTNLQCGIYLAIILSLPSMLAIWFSPYLLVLVGEAAGVVESARLLLHGLVWGFPGFLLFLVFREFTALFALARIVMLICLSSIPLTFVANYILIYGYLGFPPLGIAGIGYAGAGIMWFMFLCVFLYCKKHPSLKQYIIYRPWSKSNYRKIIDMLYLGTPSGLIYVLDTGMFSVAGIMMGYFGMQALAAHQIAMQCATLAYSVQFALSMSTALLVSQAAGANNMLQVKRYTYSALVIGLIISGTIALIFIVAPGVIARIFLYKGEQHYAEIQQYAVSFLAIASLLLCFDMLQTIMNGALRGMKDTFIPMLLSISCYWVLGVGGAYYFAFHAGLGARGIWYGITLGISSVSIILTLRFWRRV